MSDEDDNVYAHPAVVAQVLNDLSEKKREEERKVTCWLCDYKFVPTPDKDGVRCPKCHNAQGDED